MVWVIILIVLFVIVAIIAGCLIYKNKKPVKEPMCPCKKKVKKQKNKCPTCGDISSEDHNH